MERAEPLTAATARLPFPLISEQDREAWRRDEIPKAGSAAREARARDGLHQAEFASHACGHRAGFTLRLRLLRLGLLRWRGGKDETV